MNDRFTPLGEGHFSFDYATRGFPPYRICFVLFGLQVRLQLRLDASHLRHCEKLTDPGRLANIPDSVTTSKTKWGILSEPNAYYVNE